MSDALNRLTAALADRYRIERELGQGGMATVYLAQDLRHDRKVALKVLRAELAAVIGAARFLQEIKTTANLQHPHILALHDSGEVDGTVFYVMPYVEGESLRDRLTREKQLSVEEAIRITREVASALDYAHRHGVIHRDIKPENILLHDGSALVADFGIALAASRTGAGRITETGMSLGTPHYMSPEQAMGERELDARSDVYALGCVAYEMLSGEPPCTGPTAQAILARVVTEEPRSLTLQRKTIPLHVEAAVIMALSKLPADRFASAAQFAEAFGNPSLARPIGHTTSTAPSLASVRRGPAAWAPWAAVLAITGLAAWGWLRPKRVTRAPPVTRFSIEFVGAGRVLDAQGSPLAVSPDGSRIVYLGENATGSRALYTRALDREDPVEIAGTVGAMAPFFSPDGASLGFIQDNRIRKVALAGGAVTTISEASTSSPAWGLGDLIYFSTLAGLFRVSAAGGQPELVAAPDSAKGDSYRWPDPLPDGKSVLVTLVRQGAPSLAAISLPDGRLHEIGQGGMYPRWVDGGFIAFVQTDGTLFGARYDARRFRLTSAPGPVAEGVRFGPAFPAKLGIARTGAVAYLGGQNTLRELVVVERPGRITPIAVPSRLYVGPRFSPDGQRLAFQVLDVAGGLLVDLWTYDLRSGSLSRATFDSASINPEWKSDGKRLVYLTRGRVFSIATDGSGARESLLAVPGRSFGEIQPARDGKALVLRDNPVGVGNNRDIWILSTGSGDSVRPLLRTPFDERSIALSPDGKWLAYVSNEAGSDEVYLRRLEAGSGRWRVSRSGGFEPRWGSEGRELFFRLSDSVLSVGVQLQARAEPRIGPSRVVLVGNFDTDRNRPIWDVSPDGKRFAFTRTQNEAGVRRINLVLHWFDRLRAAPSGVAR
ncbi:MAG TPA: protein kinase [Gemmatimonadales bacterium]|nr:protein kinase [Gemmatimonadales bacterium]